MAKNSQKHTNYVLRKNNNTDKPKYKLPSAGENVTLYNNQTRRFVSGTVSGIDQKNNKIYIKEYVYSELGLDQGYDEICEDKFINHIYTINDYFTYFT